MHVRLIRFQTGGRELWRARKVADAVFLRRVNGAVDKPVVWGLPSKSDKHF